MRFILGPLPCATCRAPVTIVRRDVEQPCDIRDSPDRAFCTPVCRCIHTHTLPDVGPFTSVDEDGARHECR